ncbi:MAG: glycosyltransferase 87 family protein [Actinomycetota bacterium]|nr:glycosyltransferase 87 family protein [Actinomycetota bacterium]
MSVRSPVGATPSSAGVELSGASRPRRRDVSVLEDRRGLAGVVGLLVGTLLIAVSASDTASLLPESVRPVPRALAGAFGQTGIDLHAGGTIAVLCVIFASYLAVVGAASRLSGRTVLLVIAAVQILVLLAPALISTDVFSYQAYARMGSVYGVNPYLNGPHAIQPDSIFPYVGAKWSYIPSAYGPAFTIFSYLAASLSVAAGILAFKALAGMASVAIIALVWRLACLRGLDPVKAVALVGLNPLLVLYGIGGGHNDLLMLAVSTGAIYLIVAHRGRLGGGLLVLSVAIKLTAGLLIPFAYAAGGAERERGRRRDVLLGVGVGVALLLALSGAVFGAGALNVFATVQRSQSEGDWHSIPGLVGTLGPTLAGHIIGYLLEAVFLGVTVWLLRRVWRGGFDWVNAAGWATFAMLATAGSLLPWYVSWLLPLAAVSTDRRIIRPTLWLSGVVLTLQMLQFAGTEIFGYLPTGSSALGI